MSFLTWLSSISSSNLNTDQNHYSQCINFSFVPSPLKNVIVILSFLLTPHIQFSYQLLMTHMLNMFFYTIHFFICNILYHTFITKRTHFADSWTFISTLISRSIFLKYHPSKNTENNTTRAKPSFETFRIFSLFT